jgi:hypothetical protein
MHRETREMLIGSTAMLLFGAAIIRWPAFADIVDRYFYHYALAIWRFAWQIF